MADPIATAQSASDDAACRSWLHDAAAIWCLDRVSPLEALDRVAEVRDDIGAVDGAVELLARVISPWSTVVDAASIVRAWSSSCPPHDVVLTAFRRAASLADGCN